MAAAARQSSGGNPVKKVPIHLQVGGFSSSSSMKAAI